MKRLSSLLLALTAVAGCAAPAPAAARTDLTQARALMAADDPAEAAHELRGLTARDPSNADAWHLLGVALLRTGDHAAAAAAFERRLELGPSAVSSYDLACARARLGDVGRAFEALEDALNEGPSLDDVVQSDPDLASLRADARFARILERISSRRSPCRARVEYRQLDFMLGDWTVHTREGQEVGRSRFEIVADGCSLLESYTQGASYTGTGLHGYDAGLGRWHQAWTDSGGGAGDLVGELREGAMHYEGTVHDLDGNERHVRGGFVPQGPDAVLQFGEITEDGGRTWASQFELHYRRTLDGWPDPAGAVEHVLEIDRILAKQRDLDTEDVSLATSIRSYVRGLDQIDFTRCPPEFGAAFRRHRDAWESSISFFQGHDDLRGEMHVLFDKIRAVDPQGLEGHFRAIMDTWGEVDAIVQQTRRP